MRNGDMCRDCLGSGLIDPKDDSCSDADCREEGVCIDRIGLRCAPILEPGEQVLDPVALPVDELVVWEGYLAASA